MFTNEGEVEESDVQEAKQAAKTIKIKDENVQGKDSEAKKYQDEAMMKRETGTKSSMTKENQSHTVKQVQQLKQHQQQNNHRHHHRNRDQAENSRYREKRSRSRSRSRQRAHNKNRPRSRSKSQSRRNTEGYSRDHLDYKDKNIFKKKRIY